MLDRLRRLIVPAVLGVVLFSLIPARASAHDGFKVGVRAGYFTKVEEPFVGGELLFRVAPSVYFNPNVEYIFVNSGNLWTFNGDFHYDFPTHNRTYVWLGAGLGLVRDDPEGPDNANSDAALNLLGGIGLKGGGVIPYLQLKGVLKDDSLFSIAFGLRF